MEAPVALKLLEEVLSDAKMITKPKPGLDPVYERTVTAVKAVFLCDDQALMAIEVDTKKGSQVIYAPLGGEIDQNDKRDSPTDTVWRVLERELSEELLLPESDASIADLLSCVRGQGRYRFVYLEGGTQLFFLIVLSETQKGQLDKIRNVVNQADPSAYRTWKKDGWTENMGVVWVDLKKKTQKSEQCHLLVFKGRRHDEKAWLEARKVYLASTIQVVQLPHQWNLLFQFARDTLSQDEKYGLSFPPVFCKVGGQQRTKEPCKFFAKGYCRKGDACSFSHEIK